jgi:SAM-dependent methyltransferase/glycosyltransferase involved in cell wall biosynthesis
MKLSRSNGLFRIVRPSVALEFTGERLTTGISGQVEMEHLHRYSFARDFCVDKDVLDVAGGEGYGSMMLASVARSVIGVERDVDAVAHAKRTYMADNLAFEAGDALELPLADGSRDVIISFETLEHLSDQQRFLQEVRRVLRQGGLLIISTPDRLVHSGIGMPVNPHHVLELSRLEFVSLLQQTFENSIMLSQRAMVGSVLLGEPGGLRSYERRDATTIEATDGVARAVYLVGLASDAALPTIPSSIYAAEHSVDSLLASISSLKNEIANLENEIANAQRRDAETHKRHGEELQVQASVYREQLAVQHRTMEQELQVQASVYREQLAVQHRTMEQELQVQASVYREQLAALSKLRQDTEERARQLRDELTTLRNATGVRLGLFATRTAARLPGPVRRAARSSMRGVLAQVRRLRSGGSPAALEAPNGIEPPAPSGEAGAQSQLQLEAPAAELLPTTVKSLTSQRFSQLEAFPTFRIPAGRARISVVTDSIGPSSLFGGVASALLLGALLANRLDGVLRIVTRHDVPDADPVRTVLASNGVALDGPLEMAFAPVGGLRDLPIMDNDVFLTTSWWTTRATLGSAPRDRIAMLVQEDERMFYPNGDERLFCAETLSQPGIPVVVNSRLLFDHFVLGHDPLPNIGENGMWFEPAFPGGASEPHAGKRRFFFYARPNNNRNLFWRGMEVLEAAISEGLFAPDQWEMFWVGKDVPEVALPRGVTPVRVSGLGWDAYQALVASMDAGLVLMDTPHPSYPPLDLAAAGAAVLTNTHPGKDSLHHYSANILMAPPTLDGLLEGMRRLETLALDDKARADNRAADRIGRDWIAADGPLPYAAPWCQPLAERLTTLRKGRPRIAWLYERPDTSTFRYRCFNMVDSLARKRPDIGAAWFEAADVPALTEELPGLAVLVICRVRYDAAVARLVSRARAAGVRVLFDCDDLVFDTRYVHLLLDTLDQDTASAIAWDTWFALIGRIEGTARLCQGGITTNPFLARHLGTAIGGAPVGIVPNFLEREQEAVSRRLLAAKRARGFRSTGRNVIGYFSGSPSHNRDFAVAAPALARLLAADPNVGLRIVGFLDSTGPLAAFAERVEIIPLQDYLNLQRVIAEVEINIAPLQDNVFTNCKSELKFFEAAAVGTWTVATPTSTFSKAIRDGVTGRLARAQEWDVALAEAVALVRNPGRYAPIAEAAAAEVYEAYTPGRFADDIVSAAGLT